MLDYRHPCSLAAWPHLHVYPDLAAADRFYVFSHPRLAPGGLTLLLYRRGGVLSGGQLTLTTTLGLTDAERTAVTAALTPDDAPAPRLTAPQWSDGRVTARIGDVLTLTGRPSLLGDNTCALSASLTADQAREVEKLWTSTDKWLTLDYEVAFSGQAAEAATTRPKTGLTLHTRRSEATTLSHRLSHSFRPSDGRPTEINV